MSNEPATRILENAQHILAALYEGHEDALRTARFAWAWTIKFLHPELTPEDKQAFLSELARSGAKESSLPESSSENRAKAFLATLEINKPAATIPPEYEDVFRKLAMGHDSPDISHKAKLALWSELATSWPKESSLPELPSENTAKNGIQAFLSVLDTNKPTGRIPPEYEGDFHQLAAGCRSPDVSERITGWKARILLHHLGQSGEPAHVFQEDLVNAVLGEREFSVLSTLSKFDPGPDASGFRQSLANAWEKRTVDNDSLIAETARQVYLQLVWGQDRTGQSSLQNWSPPGNRTAMGR